MDTNEGNTLIDFWSPQCGPCIQLSPIIDEIKQEYSDINVVKINVAEDMDEAIKYGVRALPTLVLLRDGEVVHKMVGTQSKDDIVEEIEKHLA